MYYENKRISNSDITFFENNGPELFYEYKFNRAVNDNAAKESYYINGDLLHTMILEEHRLLEKFYVSDAVVPTGKLADFVRLKANYIKMGNTVEEAIKNAHLASDLQYTLDTTLKKAEDSVYKAYSEAIANCQPNASIVSLEDYTRAEKCLNKLKDYKVSRDLLFNIENDNKETINEFEIYHDIHHCQNLEAKCKLDRVIIDHENKTAIIVDFKTTSSLAFFNRSYYKYKYYRQLAYYRWGLRKYLFDKYFTEYTVVCKIVAMELSKNMPLKVFTVSETDLVQGENELITLISTMHWHLVNDVWVDKNLYEGESIVLNIFKNDQEK